MITNLDVVIERDSWGRLHAFVSQNGVRGADILKDRSVREVADALHECDSHFRKLYGRVAIPRINYTMPGATL